MESDFYVPRVCRIRRCRRLTFFILTVLLLAYLLLQSQVDVVNMISAYGLKPEVSAAELQELHEASVYFEQKTTCSHRTMTIVSGYLNIGSFRKGFIKVHTAGHYQRWAGAIGSIENPIVFFTDDVSMARLFVSLRNKSGIDRCTRLHFVNRNVFWGFQMRETIATVLSQPGYPGHYPNTVLPDYGAVMHSKYSMLQLAIRADPFRTEFFAWMDVGLFRDEAEWKHRPIRLLPPAELDEEKVAFNQAFKPQFDLTPENVFRNNLVYVGGGFFLAKKLVMQAWCEQYRNFTMYFLRRGLANTDQQVIYAMFLREFTDESQKASMKHSVLIQPFFYESGDPIGDWYQLKKLSKDTGDRQMALETMGGASFSWHSGAQVESSGGTTAECNNELTIVTGYFNFGSFARSTDAGWVVLDEAVYADLASRLGRMQNTLLFYSDSHTLLDTVRTARERATLGKCTRTVLLTRTDLWSWQMLPSLYAKRARHTVPELYAALHSKFALLENATREKAFASPYLAWCDLSTLQALEVKTRSFIFRQRLHTIESSALQNVPVEIEVEVSALSRATARQADEPSPSPSSSLSLCERALALSTKYLAASRSAMQRLAQAYKFVAQMTLAWNVTLLDNQTLLVTLCGSSSNLSRRDASNVRALYSDKASWPLALAEASLLYL